MTMMPVSNAVLHPRADWVHDLSYVATYGARVPTWVVNKVAIRHHSMHHRQRLLPRNSKMHPACFLSCVLVRLCEPGAQGGWFRRVDHAERIYVATRQTTSSRASSRFDNS